MSKKSIIDKIAEMPREKNKEKYYTDFGISKVDKDFLRKQELYNLHKKPKKDSPINTPHIQVDEPNVVQQADLLFLPHDDGFKYALIVVDLGSRLTDAVPLKDKKSESVKKAFQEIYKRGILKIPKRMEVDPGAEFKGEVKDYFDKHGVHVRYGKPGRHRQQALAERRNQVIGEILLKRMSAQELLTGQTSTEWVEDLPVVLKALNKHYSSQKPKKAPDEPLCEGDSCELLDEGTKVRAILDEPKDVTSGKRLHGRFRTADIRWDPKIRTIERILLRPGYPPMYLLNGDPQTPYTKNQLQVVPEDEEAPPSSVIRGQPTTFVVQKILDKKKMKGKIFYKVRWKGFDKSHDSWEPRSNLMEDIPETVKEYELKLKEINI